MYISTYFSLLIHIIGVGIPLPCLCFALWRAVNISRLHRSIKASLLMLWQVLNDPLFLIHNVCQLVVICLIGQMSGIIYVTIEAVMFQAIMSSHGYLPISTIMNTFAELGTLMYLFLFFFFCISFHLFCCMSSTDIIFFALVKSIQIIGKTPKEG